MQTGRLITVAVLVFFFFGAIVYKLYDIQVAKHEEMIYKARYQQLRTEDIMSERGRIYDRNNVLLAYTKIHTSFYVNLARFDKDEKKERLAERFSAVTQRPVSDYIAIMKPSRGKVFLETDVPASLVLQLKAIKEDGLYVKEEHERIYVNGRMAAHVLGFVDKNNRGLGGVEKSFNDILAGRPGTRTILQSPKGGLITFIDALTRQPVSGDDLYLTIDGKLQGIVESELEAGMESGNVTAGVAILMDPNNGEVLAFACKEDFDPNNYQEYPDSLYKNIGVTDIYAPGSTMKSISIAAAMDKNLCSENSSVYCERGLYKPYRDVKIRDEAPHTWLTTKEILAKSSNVGVSKIIEKMGQDDFYSYLRAFGFGNRTEIALPAETRGSLKKPALWSGATRYALSYGYEIDASPLQMATAYSALVNGGILYEPQIVKKLKSSDNNKLTEGKPKAVRRVIEDETSRRMRYLLNEVVENGTGKGAKVEGLKVGGKTGTSRRFTGSAHSKLFYSSSFIGFFPLESPKYVLLVIYGTKATGKYHGGEVAAPVFSKIASKIHAEELLKKNEGIELKFASDTTVSGDFTFSENYKKTQKQNDRVKDFNPQVMPDLYGYTLREAITVLNSLKLEIEIAGSGKVTKQSIPPGGAIAPGMKCVITAIDSNSPTKELY
ncbi:MAG: transpeptidase family protein [Ignavibacteriaceae bacterium]|nr:transpeptidase family protein [Ignavibacteriaceae bacterium]